MNSFTSRRHHHRRDHLRTYQLLLPLLLPLQQEQLQRQLQQQHRQQGQRQQQHLKINTMTLLYTRGSKAIKDVLTGAVSSEHSSPVSSNLVTRFLDKVVEVFLLYNNSTQQFLTVISTLASAQMRAARETISSSFSITDISSKGAMLFSPTEDKNSEHPIAEHAIQTGIGMNKLTKSNYLK